MPQSPQDIPFSDGSVDRNDIMFKESFGEKPASFSIPNALQKIALTELQEKDFQYQAASLEQMLALLLHWSTEVSKQMENENTSIWEDRVM